MEQNPLSQTPLNLHKLAVQLHTHALCHRSAIRPEYFTAIQDDRRRKEMELGIFTLYKLAIVYLNREKMLRHLGKVPVDFLDHWRPDSKTNPLLSLYHKAYGMTVGPKGGEATEEEARIFKEELQALEDQLEEEDFANLGILGYKAFWKLYIQTKSSHYFFDLGEIVWDLFRKAPSVMSPGLYHTWVNIFSSTASICKDERTLKLWLKRMELFIKGSEGSISSPAFRMLWHFYELQHAFVIKDYKACLEAVTPELGDRTLQVNTRFLKLQAAYKQAPREKKRHYNILSAQIRFHLKAGKSEIKPRRQMPFDISCGHIFSFFYSINAFNQ